MDHANRLWLDLETGADGPCGVARDEYGRSFPFTGWLELIAVIEAPLDRAEANPEDAAMPTERDTPASHDRGPGSPSQSAAPPANPKEYL